MCSEWLKTRLGEFCEIIMGQSPPSSTYNEEGVGLPFYQGVKDFGRKYPKKRVYCSNPLKVAKKWDVLLSVRAPVGEINVANEDCCIGRGLSALRTKNGSQEFLYYLMLYLKRIWRSYESGTTFEAITKVDIENLEVIVPPNPEQHKIAEILGALDDKIELNYEMNRTLEAIAQAIFKNWFVDFEPFKDSLVYNEELGKEIPEGWEVVELKEICNINMGQSPPSSTYNEIGDGLPFFQGVRDFGFRYPKPSVYCSSPTKIAEPGNILFSVRAPVGELNVAMKKSCIGRGVASLCYKFGSNSFLFYLLRLHQNYWTRTYEGEGTVFGNVTKEDLELFELIFPRREIVENFNSIIRPLDELIKINEQESNILSQIRDTLLPKLLSGEIRVKVEEELDQEIKELEKINKQKQKTLDEIL